jgi:hypothetical protein
MRSGGQQSDQETGLERDTNLLPGARPGIQAPHVRQNVPLVVAPVFAGLVILEVAAVQEDLVSVQGHLQGR